jgi:hypothetical protein
MKGCARTCLLWIVGWAGLACAFFYYFRTLGELGDGLFWASGGAGACVMLALAYVLGIGAAARERSALLQSVSGAPPVDGKWIAVSGRIHSLHRLHAPLSGESVVAYTYKIWRTEGSGKSSSQVNHFEGKALVPSTISTRTGSVKLLSVPTFDVKAAVLQHEAALRNAKAYIAATQFESTITPKEMRTELGKEWTDDDGNFRVDKRSTNAHDVPLESCHLDETHILQNEAICAFGLYSAAKGGLIPHPNWAKQTRIMRGDAETVAAQLRTKMLRYVIGVVVFGGAVFGIVKLVQMNAVPYS